ncbi:hypothetical protein D9V86_08845 [Bacteroidetes/Chlorobi group bacterium ChocPot_Mid]|nr:MAG: hypothetical protein D9V86_08845 [Bacteroidetes/Chlorobi group bacterium ChocPot_Mid]
MNLDELISKYLDGELTEKEDEILWNSMTSDLNSNECETARFKFDSAVSLQLAMREDASSINPPDKLVAETEDMILMRIFSNAPEASTRQRRRGFIWSSFPLMAAVIAFFMFIFVFEISDLKFNHRTTISNKHENIEENSLISEQNYNLAKSSKSDKSVKSLKNRQEPQLLTASLINNENNNYLSNEVIANEAIERTESSVKSNINPPINSINEKPESENLGELSNATNPALSFDGRDFNYSKLSNNLPINLIYNGIANTGSTKYISLQPLLLLDNKSESEVEVSSMYGSDFVNGDLSVKKISISHFSQSVAYAVNQDERFGVELGLSRYTYVDKGVVNVEHKIGGISGVESYEGGYDFSIGYPQEISINADKQLLWGTIFYENSFVRVRDFAFTGRVGLGGSSEGAMGYGRLYAEYSLFNGFKITVGTEGRMFNANFSNFNKDEKIFKYSAALLYGIEFKF